MANETMTQQQKREAIAAEWAKYRAASQAIPRTLPYSGHKRSGVYREGFLEKDEVLWRQYLAAEKAIGNVPEKKSA